MLGRKQPPTGPQVDNRYPKSGTSLVALLAPAYAGDLGSIPGSGRSLEEGMATHSSILNWKIPWTEESGGLVHGVTKMYATQLSG